MSGRRHMPSVDRPAARRGMVLIVVLIVVAMVALAGYRFAETMVIENRAVVQYGEGLQAQHAVGSGEELLHAFLQQPHAARERAGGWFDNRGLFRGALVRGGPFPARRCRFSVVSPLVQQEQTLGIRFGLENESARLNLAVLVSWDRQRPGSARRALMNLPGMTPEVADAILDWVDADSELREFGAEDDHYAGLRPPYAPRNGRPETLEELLLVRGVTRQLLFGTDPDSHKTAYGDRRTGPDENRRLPGTSDAAADPWAALLTLYSTERNVDPRGRPRIDLNDDALAPLHQRLAAALDQDWANFIVAFRQYGPCDANEPVTENVALQLDLTEPGRFAIASVLDLLGADGRGPKVCVPAASSRPATVLLSPLAGNPQRLRDELPRLMDYVSITSAKTIAGRINVNLAPPAVLRAAPGLSEATTARIVANRATTGDHVESPGRRHAVWLLTEGLVEHAQMKSLMPYVTAGGDVFRGQVVGFFDTPGPAARAEVVIDAASKPSRLVYRKDLSQFGPGCARTLLGAESEATGGPELSGQSTPLPASGSGAAPSL